MKPKRLAHFVATSTLLVTALSSQSVTAATLYWKTSAASAWDSASWATAPGGPYTSAWAEDSDVVFEANGGAPLTIAGPSAVSNFQSIIANENVTLSTPNSTLGTGGTMASVTVADRKTLNFAAQNLSTAAGTGFIKNGPGTWTLANGNSYPGGFTLNAGTVAVGGNNALGSGGALTINGGAIRSDINSSRNLSGKFTGITVNADFTLGDTGFTGGTGSLTFDSPINLGSANRTITVNAGTTITGTGVISGTGGLTKIGTSTLTLNGSAVHTFTGGLTLGGGNIALTYSNLGTPTNLIDPANPLNFSYGTPSLTFLGKSASANIQTFGDVTVNNSRATMLVSPGGSFALTLGTINSGMGAGSGILCINQAAAGLTATTTSAPDPATGIYGPRVIYSSNAGTTRNWAAAVSGTGPYTIGDYTGYVAMAATDPTPDADNVLWTTGTLFTTDSQTHHTLKVAGGATLTLGLGTTLTLTGGGILTDGSAACFINGGTITAGNGGNTMGYNPYELVISPFNTALSSIISVIADNGANPVSLTLNGGTGNAPAGAAVALGTQNTYTGTTTLNGASTAGNDFRTVDARLANATAVSTFGRDGTIALNGAIVRVNGNDTTNRAITLNNTSGFHVQANTVTLNGQISGTGNLSVDCNNGGNLVLGGDNSFSGDALFQTDGKLTLNHVDALRNATLNLTGQRVSAVLTSGSGNLAYNIGGLKGNAVDLNLGTGGGAGGKVSIGSNNQSNTFLGALSGSAGLSKKGTGTQTLVKCAYTGDTVVEAGTLKLGTAGQVASASRNWANDGTLVKNSLTVTLAELPNLAVGQTIHIAGTNTLDTTIFGIDSSTNAPRVYLTDALATGSYTASFDAMDGSIASPTIEVKAGATLDVSALASAFPVSSTQILGGAGAVTGPIHVSGKLSPGVGAADLATTTGTLATGNATFDSTGEYVCTIDGASSDLLAAGTLTVDAAAKITLSGTPTAPSYLIATYTGAEPAHFDESALPSGYELDYTEAGKIKLVQDAGGGTEFDNWATGAPYNLSGPDAQAGADPDNDGVKNIVEFALNGDPTNGSDNGISLAKVQDVGGNPALTLTIATRKNTSFGAGTGAPLVSGANDGVVYTIEGSQNLGTWTATITEIPAITTGLPDLSATDYEYHTFKTAGPVSSTPKDFIRVKVEGQ